MLFCIDWAAWDLKLVHLIWWRRSWIKIAVQLLQQAASNALACAGIVFGGDNCICFADGVSSGDDYICFRAVVSFLGLADVATMHAFLH